MCMLENQIPLWLISLIHPNQSLLCEYLSYAVFGDNGMTQLPWRNGEGEEPLHPLAASHRTHLSLIETSIFNGSESKGHSFSEEFQLFDGHQAHLLCLLAQLNLPFFYISNNSNVFLSNLIVFEMSPETQTNFGVTSYITFMKTLINNADDVKVLRVKGILYSMLASDEEVVGIFKSIDTYGFSNFGLFHDVKMRIEVHCSSKARTWMADLINTKFQSPWTIIALVAATFVQTYFTINPTN